MAVPKQESKRFINILVLGESGVGKSTFINAFVNYMTYQNLKEAEAADKITCLIPCKFTVTELDNNGKWHERIISVGNDKNETLAVGEAATQGTKPYVFPIDFGATSVRIIDTPGMGDRRGVDKDNENFENILAYLGELDEIHGICVLLKPDIPRRNVLFEFCIKQLLSRLEKSASNNMIFVFTNSRGTFYKAGETLPILRNILDEIKSKPPYCDIPVHANNVFIMDNEAFKYLMLIKNSVQFTEKQRKDFAESWEQSSKVCWDLIGYISGDENRPPLKPHKIRDTVSINEARRVIIQLTQPLAEIAQHIVDNLNILKRYKRNMKNNTDTLQELKNKLYIPVMNLQVVEFKQPRTVCTSASCCTFYQVEGIKKCHYSQLCHNPCHLTHLPRDIIGSPGLVNCSAIDASTKKCRECSCDFSSHMHIYYETKVVSGKIIDKNVNDQIVDSESALREAKKHIERINKRRDEYEEEKDLIMKSTAKFAHFLQNNAVTPYNDAYETYINYLIDRECSMGVDADRDMINHLKNLQQRYKEEKSTLNQAFDLSKDSNNFTGITADDIFDCVQALYSLRHTGDKICELFNKQTNARKYENENTEYVHPHVFKKPNKSKNKGSEGGKQNDFNKSNESLRRSKSFGSLLENSKGHTMNTSQEMRHKNKNFNKYNRKGNNQNCAGKQTDARQRYPNNYPHTEKFGMNHFHQRNFQHGPHNIFPNNIQPYANQPQNFQNNWGQGNPNYNQNVCPGFPNNVPPNNYQPGPRNDFHQNHLQVPQNLIFPPPPIQNTDQINQLKAVTKVLNVAIEEFTRTSPNTNKNSGNQNMPTSNQNFGITPNNNPNPSPFNYQTGNWQNQQFPQLSPQNAFGNQLQVGPQANHPQNQYNRQNMNRGQNFGNFGNRGRGGRRNFVRNNFDDNSKPDNNQNFLMHNHSNSKRHENRSDKPINSKTNTNRNFEQNINIKDNSGDAGSHAEAKEKSFKDKFVALFSGSSDEENEKVGQKNKN